MNVFCLIPDRELFGHAGQIHHPYLLVLLVADLRVFAPLQVMLAVLEALVPLPYSKSLSAQWIVHRSPRNACVPMSC